MHVSCCCWVLLLLFLLLFLFMLTVVLLFLLLLNPCLCVSVLLLQALLQAGWRPAPREGETAWCMWGVEMAPSQRCWHLRD
jgi:hypothetical protein